ncbi:MAG: hypothetical protein U1C33_06030, partial [Candidatus Cloacimonadaceae bacterium]|nr:hypothetical protein [Candidatus Cloacimonadaceae bacterium]
MNAKSSLSSLRPLIAAAGKQSLSMSQEDCPDMLLSPFITQPKHIIHVISHIDIPRSTGAGYAPVDRFFLYLYPLEKTLAHIMKWKKWLTPSRTEGSKGNVLFPPTTFNVCGYA